MGLTLMSFERPLAVKVKNRPSVAVRVSVNFKASVTKTLPAICLSARTTTVSVATPTTCSG